MDYYDVIIKRFKDGTIQYRASLINLHYRNFDSSPGFNKPKSDPVRSARNSLNRTVNKLYDILHNNEWDYFFTLTLDPKIVEDRYDYKICSDYIHHFTDLLYRSNCLYVIVPEKHKDGAWHFHGLINNTDSLKLVVNDYGFLEFKQFNYGFCSLSRVVDTAKASNYILKYLIKGYDFLDIPKGKKRYWASRGLDLPDIENDIFTNLDLEQIFEQAYFIKKIDNDFYNGYIIDVGSENAKNI